jgi:hypothetical protein
VIHTGTSRADKGLNCPRCVGSFAGLMLNCIDCVKDQTKRSAWRQPRSTSIVNAAETSAQSNALFSLDSGGRTIYMHRFPVLMPQAGALVSATSQPPSFEAPPLTQLMPTLLTHLLRSRSFPGSRSVPTHRRVVVPTAHGCVLAIPGGLVALAQGHISD